MKEDLQILMGDDLGAIKRVMNRKGLVFSPESIMSRYLSLVRMELDRLWEFEDTHKRLGIK